MIFEAASIERWNDHIRPSGGFSELDKQSHKMICAYVIGQLEPEADRQKLIEGGIFEFLHRLVLTDIKPPIFHRLMEEKGEDLNRWAVQEILPELQSIPGGFGDRFARYFTDASYCTKEKKILEAAHYWATKWEFGIIYDMCRSYYGVEQTRHEIDSKLEELERFPAFHAFVLDKNFQAFTDLLGELRFQQRWSRSPRLPKTSVIGHMLIVAVLAYLCSCEIGACPKRSVNNFLGGLFHDVPEVLTRDIVSPVKNSVEGLDELIKNIEEEQMERVLYPLIPQGWREELTYFTRDEFATKIRKDGKTMILSSDEVNASYNGEEYDPVDGEIIRGCDHLAACIETYVSHNCGVTSHTLQEANRGLYAKYRNACIGGMDFGCMFDYFRI